MKNNATLVSSLLAALVLTACGGGGGGSSPAATSASSSASSPSAASAPETAGPDTAASAPAAASTPTVTGETPPSLTSPQAGSTAATGTGAQGVWSTGSGYDKTTAFIDPQDNISYLSTVSGYGSAEFFGVATATASSWTLTSGVQYFYPGSSTYYLASSGSGTYTAKQAFAGTYMANGTPQTVAWTYDAANALAVTQSSVAGTWAETGTSLTIGSDGTLSGTISNCAVGGTLMLTTSGSSQNLYTMNVTSGTTGGSCAVAGKTLSGNAAIVFLPVTGSTLYTRTILFVIHSADNSALAYGQVSKQ